MIPVDLWELPQPQLTSSIADKTEENFYSRCPPEMRPRFMNMESETPNTISQTSLVSPSNVTTEETENGKLEYGPDMEKVCRSNSIHDTRTDTGIGIGTGTRTTYY